MIFMLNLLFSVAYSKQCCILQEFSTVLKWLHCWDALPLTFTCLIICWKCTQTVKIFGFWLYSSRFFFSIFQPKICKFSFLSWHAWCSKPDCNNVIIQENNKVRDRWCYISSTFLSIPNYGSCLISKVVSPEFMKQFGWSLWQWIWSKNVKYI